MDPDNLSLKKGSDESLVVPSILSLRCGALFNRQLVCYPSGWLNRGSIFSVACQIDYLIGRCSHSPYAL